MQDDHFRRIYTTQAARYQHLIAAEDVENNLLALLTVMLDLEGRRVVDVGSGTGRLPRLLHRLGAVGLALDLHAAMLLENHQQQQRNNVHWPLIVGDVRRLPLPNACAGLVTAGWAIGHFCGWYGSDWRQHVERAVGEMLRVAARGGDVIIIETLGTGVSSAEPPTDTLEVYYRLLEERWGFERHVIATDYQFSSVSEAVTAMRFFFGETLARKILRGKWRRVPEWTGVWRLRC